MCRDPFASCRRSTQRTRCVMILHCSSACSCCSNQAMTLRIRRPSRANSLAESVRKHSWRKRKDGSSCVCIADTLHVWIASSITHMYVRVACCVVCVVCVRAFSRCGCDKDANSATLHSLTQSLTDQHQTNTNDDVHLWRKRDSPRSRSNSGQRA